MKIECIQEKIKKAVSQAERVAGKNLNLPVLSCVLIRAEKGQVAVSSTDLDLGYHTNVAAKVYEEGVVAVPAKPLASFFANLTGKNITLKTEGNTLFVTTSKNKTTIKCLPPDDFPTIPEAGKDNCFDINSAELVRGLRAVWYSSSNSNIKAELSSVFVYPEDDSVVFAATDSFRLAEKRIKNKTPNFGNILIPFKNTQEIIKVLEEGDESVRVCINKNQITIFSESTTLTSRVVDGTFPDYHQIIPKEFKTEAVLLKDDLLRALKIATIFSDTFNQVNITVVPRDKKFELTTKNNNIGESTTVLDAAISGEPTEANFNYRYIADCLQSISTDSVSLAFSGPSRPVVIKGVGDKSFMYLVMPMNR